MASTPRTRTQSPAGAARREASKKAPAEKRSITFLDRVLELPDELPGALFFELGEMEASGEIGRVGAITRTLQVILGPEQYARVKAAVVEDGIAMSAIDGVLTDLVESLYAAYGMAEGEPEAS